MGDGMIWQQMAVFGIVGGAAVYLVRSFFSGGDGEGGCKACPKK